MKTLHTEFFNNLFFFPYQEVQSSSLGGQSDQTQGHHGGLESPWQHGHHSSQQPDTEGVELVHRQPHPHPHGKSADSVSVHVICYSTIGILSLINLQSEWPHAKWWLCKNAWNWFRFFLMNRNILLFQRYGPSKVFQYLGADSFSTELTNVWKKIIQCLNFSKHEPWLLKQVLWHIQCLTHMHLSQLFSWY